MSLNEKKQNSHVQSLARALELVEVLAVEKQDLSLTEIAQRLKWPKSTVHGILTTLRDYRYVDQSSTNGRYRLGIRLFELGHKVAKNWDVRVIALPVMQKLNRQFGEMVQLATEDTGDVFYIEKVDSTQIIKIVSEIGARLPIHCSALGKVILAYMPPADVRTIINRKGMARMTKNTITDFGKLEAELLKIRNQGYGVDDQEIMEGLRCIGAPIFDMSGTVRYAVSVSVLAERLVDDYFEKIKYSLIQAAEEISYNMGYRNRSL